MKTLIVVCLLSQVAWASCGKGYYEDQGVCQYEAPAAEKIVPVVPDDVKPPKGVQPEWETGVVKVSSATVAKDTVKDDPEQGEG